MELLRPEDVFFLHVETEAVPQHICCLALVDPRSLPGGRLSREEITAGLEKRVERVPWLRWRAAWPAKSVTRPIWVPEKCFDVRRHLRWRRLSEGGDWRELRAVVERCMAEPLDHRLPLWRVEVVEGLASGKLAILLVLHHAIADGVGMLEVATSLMDGWESRAGSSTLVVDAPMRSEGHGRAGQIVGSVAKQIAEPALMASSSAAALVREPKQATRRAASVVTGIAELGRSGLFSVGNGVVSSPNRGFAIVVLERQTLRAIKRGRDVSTSDVVLSSLVTALSRMPGEAFWRRQGRRRQRVEEVRAMVPLATRRPARRASPGNWTTACSVSIPVGSSGAGSQLVATAAAMARAKRSSQPAAASAVMKGLGTWLPAPLHREMAKRTYTGRWFDMIVSTLPGPSSIPSFSGAPVELTFPVLPLAQGVPLAVGCLVWADKMAVGLTAQPEVLDVDVLAGLLGEAFGELASEAVSLRQLGEAAARGDELAHGHDLPPQVLSGNEALSGALHAVQELAVTEQTADGSDEVGDLGAHESQIERAHDGAGGSPMAREGLEGEDGPGCAQGLENGDSRSVGDHDVGSGHVGGHLVGKSDSDEVL